MRGTADRKDGSPPDQTGGLSGSGSSAPSGGSSSEEEVIDVDGGCVEHIEPQGVYCTNGDVFELPPEVVNNAVDNVVVPNGFRKGRQPWKLLYVLSWRVRGAGRK